MKVTDKRGKSTSEVSLNLNAYRDFVLFTIWGRHFPKMDGTPLRYKVDWYQDTVLNGATVWLYTEHDRFGLRAFSDTAWLYFFKDGEVIAKSKIKGWVPENFLPKTQENVP